MIQTTAERSIWIIDICGGSIRVGSIMELRYTTRDDRVMEKFSTMKVLRVELCCW